MSNHLKVSRIAAEALIAEMIDLLLARNKSEIIDESYDVSCNGLTI
tara:strand:- start:379 stop:516 length:138 start_codon:yes stop_codon:yes gene_type:complete